MDGNERHELHIRERCNRKRRSSAPTRKALIGTEHTETTTTTAGVVSQEQPCLALCSRAFVLKIILCRIRSTINDRRSTFFFFDRVRGLLFTETNNQVTIEGTLERTNVCNIYKIKKKKKKE